MSAVPSNTSDANKVDEIDYEMDDSDEESQAGTKKSPAVKVLRWVGIVLAVPLIVTLVLAWTVVGQLCTLRYRVLIAAVLALIIPAVVLSLTLDRGGSYRYDYRTSLLDPVLVLALVTVLYSYLLAGFRSDGKNIDPALRNRRRVAFLPLVVCVTAYLVAKLVLLGDHAESWKVAWTWVCLWLSLVLYVAMGRYWVDASIPHLEAIEANFLRQHSQIDFKQSVVAGLGTLHVHVQDPGGVVEGVAADRRGREKPPTEKPILVMVHGWAAGNAHWMFVLKRLSAHFRVVCVETYGCGRSERLPFRAKTALETEAILVDSFERWREAMGISEMVVCAHSLGAILASAYAMRYPKRLKHLVLASPAGVGGIPSTGDAGGSWVYKLYAFLWTRGVGPSPLLRWCGPFGVRMATFAVRRRVAWLPQTARLREVDIDKLGEYAYQACLVRAKVSGDSYTGYYDGPVPHSVLRRPTAELLHNVRIVWKFHILLAQPSSGEKAIFPLLSPMLNAYHPISETLKGASRDEEREDGISCPVSIIYGSPQEDWMPQRHGRALAGKLTQQGIKVNVHSVRDAGHTLHVDNPDGFTDALLDSWFSLNG